MKNLKYLIVVLIMSVAAKAEVVEVDSANCEYGKMNVSVSFDMRYANQYEASIFRENNDQVHLPDGDVPGAPDMILVGQKVHAKKVQDGFTFYSTDGNFVFDLIKTDTGTFGGQYSYTTKDGRKLHSSHLKCVVWDKL